jgi:lipoprotein-anchoring transpeptidase ErfK/SrfK
MRIDRILSIIGFALVFFLCASLGGSMAALSEPVLQAIPAGQVFASLGESVDTLSKLPQAALAPLQEIGSALRLAYRASTREIRVSLKLQVLYLIEEGSVQAIFPILTGQQGMETPPGQYQVLSKSPVTDMEGAIGTPLEYHVTNVPWNLFFIGRTYAIHGNYWKPEAYFGKQPTWTGSHGCVGLLPDNARQLYEWAPVGTKITIEN